MKKELAILKKRNVEMERELKSLRSIVKNMKGNVAMSFILVRKCSLIMSIQFLSLNFYVIKTPPYKISLVIRRPI